jgi:MoxR-like ATPase
LNRESNDGDLESLAKLKDAHYKTRREIARVVVGQDEVIDQLLISIFARGHCILEGVPGLAKTLMVSTLAQCLSLEFARIQFTPDLMPSDITGTEVLQEDRSTGTRELRFVRGPVFANVLLADEINRTPPKTQAALLEAMQERQVSAGGKRHPMRDPFFVLATQNPIEQEGTYPLPEAQLDRFLFKVFVAYPSPDEERQIYRLTTGLDTQKIEPVLNGPEILQLQSIVRKIPVTDYCLDYAMGLIRATRGPQSGGPDYIGKWLAWGAGPRAGQSLVLAAKGRAALDGRTSVTIEDVRAVAHAVLRHRLIPTYTAQAEGQTPDSIITRLVNEIPVRASAAAAEPHVAAVFKS